VSEEPQGLACPECEKAGTPAEYPNALKLGYHRRVAHGVQGRGKNRRKSEPRPALVEALKGMADEAGAGTGRKGPPGSEELTRALARGIGTLSMAAAIYAVETDRRLDTDELKEQNVNYLSLAPRSAHDLAEPLGAALYRSPLNRKYGRAIVDNVDVVGSLAELTILVLHWRRYFAERGEWERAQRVGAPAGEVPMAPPPPTSAGNGRLPSLGRPWTAADVEQMKSGG
jgi:hypothetical protein